MIFLIAIFCICVIALVAVTAASVTNGLENRRIFYARNAHAAMILNVGSGPEHPASRAWRRNHGQTWQQFKANYAAARRGWRQTMKEISDDWLYAYDHLIRDGGSERHAREVIEGFGWNAYMKNAVLLSETKEKSRIGPKFVNNCKCVWCSPAHRIASDEFGTLWGLYIGMGRRVLVVEVENSTKAHPEHYFIPVRGDLRPMGPDGPIGHRAQELSARNAIASTFGMFGEDYKPDKAA